MRYIECHDEYVRAKDKGLSLFIAGGITGCSDWQKDYATLFEHEDLVLLNPRREKFPANHPDINRQQIVWEYNALRAADAASFWFTKETLCPITLYELGKQLVSYKPVFIGVHPDYARKEDLEIQVGLIRPGIRIVYDLSSLADQVKGWIRGY